MCAKVRIIVDADEVLEDIRCIAKLVAIGKPGVPESFLEDVNRFLVDDIKKLTVLHDRSTNDAGDLVFRCRIDWPLPLATIIQSIAADTD